MPIPLPAESILAQVRKLLAKRDRLIEEGLSVSLQSKLVRYRIKVESSKKGVLDSEAESLLSEMVDLMGKLTSLSKR